MNNSNESLRFSRTYLEETGIRSSLLRFNEDIPPKATSLEALFWVCAVIALCIVAYLLKVA